VHGLQVVGTVHHAPGKRADTIVLVSNRGNLKDPYEEPANTTVWAARVGPNGLDDIETWDWYCGLRPNGQPIWSEGRVRDGRFDLYNGMQAKPILRDPAGGGKHVMISWCPSLNGYVMARTHERTKLGLFYSRFWRGPYTTLFYGPFVPGSGPAQIFTAQVVTMWSRNGNVAVLWSGYSGGAGACGDKSSTNYDAVHVTRFTVA
jgi:hypothetical protein